MLHKFPSCQAQVLAVASCMARRAPDSLCGRVKCWLLILRRCSLQLPACSTHLSVAQATVLQDA